MCIHSGLAAERLATDGRLASFTAAGGQVPDDVPRAVVDELSHRTPGFAWQEGDWLYHCGDGAAFLGLVGYTGVRLPLWILH